MREVSGTGSSSQEVGSQVGRSAVCLGTDRGGSLLANVLVIVLYKVSFLLQREREGERERENSNSKTLFYKDCSLGSFKNLSNN